jgi:prepilin peptidase dependent protein B
MLKQPTWRHRAQRGLSIVELMVGVAVGLFVVGGAAKLFVDNLSNNRRLLVETRINQDLRAAADLIARDLRRAGYWRNAHLGVSSDLLVPAIANAYSPVANPSTTEVTYSYAKDGNNTVEATEGFGVRRAVDTTTGRGVLELQIANGTWQPITDPLTLDIPSTGSAATTGLAITPVTPSRTAELWDACPCLGELTCTANQFKNPNPDTGAKGIHFDNRPMLEIRQFTITVRGRSVTPPTISREITETVRVRNDAVAGACPT